MSKFHTYTGETPHYMSGIRAATFFRCRMMGLSCNLYATVRGFVWNTGSYTVVCEAVRTERESKKGKNEGKMERSEDFK